MEFNRELFADLLQRAKGDRSINRFGSEADVDPGYISRLLRRQVETPPGATVLTKIAGNAANDVMIEQLLGAAGYINFPTMTTRSNLPASEERGDKSGYVPGSRVLGFSGERQTPTEAKNSLTHLDIIIGDDNSTAPWNEPAAGPPTTGIATGSYDNRAPAGAGPYNSGPNPDSGAIDDSMVEELFSFCKEMMDRPILVEAFKQIKDLGDDKLRRALKMIKMIAEMGD